MFITANPIARLEAKIDSVSRSNQVLDLDLTVDEGIENNQPLYRLFPARSRRPEKPEAQLMAQAANKVTWDTPLDPASYLIDASNKRDTFQMTETGWQAAAAAYEKKTSRMFAKIDWLDNIELILAGRLIVLSTNQAFHWTYRRRIEAYKVREQSIWHPKPLPPSDPNAPHAAADA